MRLWVYSAKSNPDSNSDLELAICEILRVTSYYKCLNLCSSMSRQAPSYRILKILKLQLLRYQQRGKGFLL